MNKPELKQDSNGQWYVVGNVDAVYGNVRQVEGNIELVWGDVEYVDNKYKAVSKRRSI